MNRVLTRRDQTLIAKRTKIAIRKRWSQISFEPESIVASHPIRRDRRRATTAGVRGADRPRSPTLP
jgi:hypothetical protein